MVYFIQINLNIFIYILFTFIPFFYYIYSSIFHPHSTTFLMVFPYRVFVNRSLHLENIKYYGFDMDYTLAGEQQQIFVYKAHHKY